MKNQAMTRQQGFTLVEIAIVLVIIGLLLGGVLKGQELINSAKVKNMANDFRNVPIYIYSYQDRFKALPGDDKNVTTHLPGATLATTGGATGNGKIEGAWDSETATDESALFWQHIRLAGLATGSTNPTTTSGEGEDATSTTTGGYYPTNVDGGRVGVQSTASSYVKNMTGAYLVCSGGIQGRFALQLDVTMDDGNTATGSMRTVDASSGTAPYDAVATNSVKADDTYNVCMAL